MARSRMIDLTVTEQVTEGGSNGTDRSVRPARSSYCRSAIIFGRLENYNR
jgi:hypothetical protein